MTTESKEIIVKRYEASAGFIVVILLLIVCVLMSCYMTMQLAYAALESGENVLGYRSGAVTIPDAPDALIVPTQISTPPTAEQEYQELAPTVTVTQQ